MFPPETINTKPLNVFQWREAPRQTKNSRKPEQIKPFNGLRDPYHARSFTIVGAEQGRKDSDRRDAIKRAIA